MTLPKPNFDPTITFGNICQIVLLSLTLIGGGFYVWGELSKSREAREKYIPIVEALNKSDTLQNERIENFADAIRNINKTQSLLVDRLTDISVAVAKIEERTNPAKGNGN